MGRLDEFAAVRAPVLVLCGSRSVGVESFESIARVLPNATFDVMRGLDHFGPEGKNAFQVGQRVGAFFAET